MVLNQDKSCGDARAVEEELRKIRLEDNKLFRRFSYRCIRKTRDHKGDLVDRETKKRRQESIHALAVPETVMAAALRSFAENRGSITFKAEDIRMHRQAGSPPLEVCLLVDTSGSMSGKRINEVKSLAGHLLRLMREPLSLVTFQECNVGVKVPGTRNMNKIKRGLCAMNAAGLTPLGDGIRATAAYIKKRRGRKHLVILITDGLPTWAGVGDDPYSDALMAARELAKTGARLICIGLEPQKEFLQKLAEAANGSLYIVDDLDHREIAAITRREKAGVIAAETVL